LCCTDAVSTKCIALSKYDEIIEHSDKLVQASSMKQAPEIRKELLTKLHAGELDTDLASSVSVFFLLNLISIKLI
jgi:hypothetical protein